MCPACLETLALLIVGVGSAGGMATLIASKFHPRANDAAEDLLNTQKQEEGPCPKQHTSTSI